MITVTDSNSRPVKVPFQGTPTPGLGHRRSLCSAVHITAVADAQHEDDEFVILDFVDDAILTDSDAALTLTARELDVAVRARVRGEVLDGLLDSLPLIRMDLAEGFRSGGLVGDRVCRHGRAARNASEAQLGHELLMRNTALLATSLGCTTNVSLILQGLEGTVKEFRGDNDGATSAASAENLNRPALCGVEYLALMCAKVAKSRRSHTSKVHLVHVGVKGCPIAVPFEGRLVSDPLRWALRCAVGNSRCQTSSSGNEISLEGPFQWPDSSWR